MEVHNLEDALDEFDARYLECYHQMTDKLASLAITTNSLLTLSSPLLSHKEMAGDEVRRDAELLKFRLSQPSVPYLDISEDSECGSESVSTTCIDTLATSSESLVPSLGHTTASTSFTDGYECVSLTQVEEFASAVGLTSCDSFSTRSYNSIIHSAPLDGPPASGYAHQPPMHRSYSLHLESGRGLVVSPDALLSHQLRMQRLLLALLLTPKLAGRRGERRNTVATYVGNPFYRGKLSPQRKKSIASLSTVPLGPYSRSTSIPHGEKRCTFEVGDMALAQRGRSDLEEPVYR